MYKRQVSCHLQIMTVLLLPLQFGCLLFLLLVWLLWLGLPVLCWVRGVKGRPDLTGNTCRFCPLSMMLGVGLSYVAFVMFRYVPSIPTLLRTLIINGCWILSNAFFCIYWYDHVVFILHFVYVVNHIYWFASVIPTSHSQNKSHLIMVYDLFDALLYSVC